MEEIEVKILEIDREWLLSKLEALGAEFEFDQVFEAAFLDHPDRRLTARGDLLRLRREGDSVVLAYKRKLSREGAKVMQETETVVGQFSDMLEILRSAGLEVTKQTRKRRVQFALDHCHLVIDQYEGELADIPPFLEIEASSRESLAHMLQKLEVDPSKALPWSTFDLIRHYGLSSS